MTVIHKIDGGIVRSIGEGDSGVCEICGKAVHHLLIKDGKVQFSEEVIIKYD